MFVVLVELLLIVAIVRLLYHSFSDPSGYALLGLFLCLQAVLYFMQRARYFLASDGERITYRLFGGVGRVQKILWRDVESIRLGPTYLHIMRRGRRPQRIPLGILSYQTLRDLKAEIIRECRRLGVPVSVVPLAG